MRRKSKIDESKKGDKLFVPPRPKRVIAERAFRYKNKKFKLKIFEPVTIEDGWCFCHVMFDGLQRVMKFNGTWGVDRLQALNHSLSTVETLLRLQAKDLRIDYGGSILGPVGEIGLPLTFHETDLLTELDHKKIYNLYNSISNRRIDQRRRANRKAKRQLEKSQGAASRVTRNA